MIHDGVILEQGTFTELQEKDGEFKRLYAELGAVPEEDKDADGLSAQDLLDPNVFSDGDLVTLFGAPQDQ